MTCVIGVEQEDGAWIGTDSFLGDGSVHVSLDRPKWFIKGDVIFAYAGDMRAAQLIEHCRPFRRKYQKETDQEYLVNVVTARVKECHVKGGFEEDPKADYLIVYRGLVYVLQEGYSLFRGLEGYTAIGTGEKAALGALAALKGLFQGDEWVKRSLTAAAKHSTGVSKPFHTLFVPKARPHTHKPPSSAG